MQIFLSYSWSDEFEADKVDNALRKKGYRVVRDKRNVEFKGNIKEFMKSIGEHDFVITLISNSYLRSPNCMFEVNEHIKNPDYKKKTLQIILSDAKIFKETDRLEYVDYWAEECKKLEERLGSKPLPNNAREGTEKELKKYRSIQKSVYEFTSFISEEKGIRLSDLEEEDYKSVTDYIEENSPRSNINYSAELVDLSSFSVGQQLDGIIKQMYNYGYFVQVVTNEGRRDGLLHKQKIEKYGYKFSQLKRFLRIGDDVHVEITEINTKTQAALLTGGLGFSPTEKFQKLLEKKITVYLKEAAINKEKDIDLSGLGLKELPKVIKELKSVRMLNLQKNRFEDIPLELDSLPRLEMVVCDFEPKRKLPFKCIVFTAK